MLNFSLVSLVNHVLLSFSDESFSVGDGFFQLSLLGSQDVGQSGLSVGDLSSGFVNHVGQSSDFRVMFVGSFVESLVGRDVFFFQINQNIFDSGDQSVNGSLGHQVHFGQRDHVSSPGS